MSSSFVFTDERFYNLLNFMDLTEMQRNLGASAGYSFLHFRPKYSSFDRETRLFI